MVAFTADRIGRRKSPVSCCFATRSSRAGALRRPVTLGSGARSARPKGRKRHRSRRGRRCVRWASTPTPAPSTSRVQREAGTARAGHATARPHGCERRTRRPITVQRRPARPPTQQDPPRGDRHRPTGIRCQSAGRRGRRVQRFGSYAATQPSRFCTSERWVDPTLQHRDHGGGPSRWPGDRRTSGEATTRVICHAPWLVDAEPRPRRLTAPRMAGPRKSHRRRSCCAPGQVDLGRPRGPERAAQGGTSDCEVGPVELISEGEPGRGYHRGVRRARRRSFGGFTPATGSPPPPYGVARFLGGVSTARSGERLGLEGLVLRLRDGSGIERLLGA